jgi:hypothetical protein
MAEHYSVEAIVIFETTNNAEAETGAIKGY